MFYDFEVDPGNCKEQPFLSLMLISQLFGGTPCYRYAMLQTCVLVSLLIRALRSAGMGAKSFAGLWLLNVLALEGYTRLIDPVPALTKHFASFWRYVPVAFASAAMSLAPHAKTVAWTCDCYARLRCWLPILVACFGIALGSALSQEAGHQFTALSNVYLLPYACGVILLLRCASPHSEVAVITGQNALTGNVRRLLAMASKLCFGVNVCHYFVIHFLNVCLRGAHAPHGFQMGHWQLAMLFWMTVLMSALLSLITFLVIEVPWQTLCSRVINVLASAGSARYKQQ